MAELESSWVLEDRLKHIACPDALKEEIMIFIRKHHDKCTGKAFSISNFSYRGTLQFIEARIRDAAYASLQLMLHEHNKLD